MKKIAIICNDVDENINKKIFEIIAKKLDLEISVDIIENTDIYEILDNLNRNEYDAYFIETLYKDRILAHIPIENLHEKVKILNYTNALFQKEDKVIAHNLDYNGFLEVILKYDIDLKDKNVILIGDTLISRAIYQVLKDLKSNIFTLINTGISYNLEAKAKFVNKLEINNLKNIEMIINSTDIGKVPQMDDTPILNFGELKPNWVIDYIFNPYKTVFLMKSEVDNSHKINGMYMQIVKILKFIALLYDDPKLYTYGLLDEVEGEIYEV